MFSFFDRKFHMSVWEWFAMRLLFVGCFFSSLLRSLLFILVWCCHTTQTTYNLFDSYRHTIHSHLEPAHSLEWPPSTSFIFRPHKRSYLCAIVWIVVFVIGDSDGYGGNGMTEEMVVVEASMMLVLLLVTVVLVLFKLLFLLLRWLACTRFSTFIRIYSYSHVRYLTFGIYMLMCWTVWQCYAMLCYAVLYVRIGSTGTSEISVLSHTFEQPFACTTIIVKGSTLLFSEPWLCWPNFISFHFIWFIVYKSRWWCSLSGNI